MRGDDQTLARMQVAGGIFIRPRRIAVARRNGRFLINMIILRQTAPEPKSFSKRLIRVILIMMTIGQFVPAPPSGCRNMGN
ncbi:MAG TPA: hypothetical protein DEQ75_02295 [Alphaproteobacteria bacterium]|nr:hypothetical protein [Alphaproteobacteria bacterium]HCV63137.1 hypothetical protein [Alphaproteobacteria bacterium]